MPCYSPLVGYRSRTVGTSGKRKLVFSRSAGFSDLEVKVPCGQCIGCRIDRSRMWAIRCVHESKMHSRNCFITLTYSDENLPFTLSLEKDHLQKFFKRLRHHIGKFRYYACGEYGDDTRRPHYHAILFGVDFADDRTLHSRNSRGHSLYISQLLSDTWGLGHALISPFTYSTAAYVARYCMKKQNGKSAYEHEKYCRYDSITGELFHVSPEFALMSNRPGIGSAWYDRFSTDVFPSDFLVHEGKTHPVPRYYLDKLIKSNPQKADKIKTKRKEARANDINSTPDRLTAREIVKKAQLTTLKRSL